VYNTRVAVRLDQLLGSSHMFSGNEEATAVRRPAKVAAAAARRPGRSLLSGHRRRRSAVFCRQRSSTVFRHVQQQSPSRSRTVIGRFQKNCRHVAQSRRPSGPCRQGRVADHCCRSVSR